MPSKKKTAYNIQVVVILSIFFFVLFNLIFKLIIDLRSESIRKKAEQIEKDNLYIHEYTKKYNPQLVVSLLGDELKINPFLRFNAPGMINNLKKQNMPVDTEFERFNSIMEIF